MAGCASKAVCLNWTPVGGEVPQDPNSTSKYIQGTGFCFHDSTCGKFRRPVPIDHQEFLPAHRSSYRKSTLNTDPHDRRQIPKFTTCMLHHLTTCGLNPGSSVIGPDGWAVKNEKLVSYIYVFGKKTPQNDGCFLKWWYPKHPKMIMFSRKNLWLLGTTILGNPHKTYMEKKTYINWFSDTFGTWFQGLLLKRSQIMSE